MASSKWKTFQDIAQILKNRKLVYWGASNWIEKTQDQVSINPEFIVDNNVNNHGIDYLGVQVLGPCQLESKKDYFIIITTANYQSVIDQLDELGYVCGEDYCCTPLLNERKYKDELVSNSASVIISSPQHFFSDSNGGGLYEITFYPYKISKVYSGKTRGIAVSHDYYYVVDMLRGIIILDKEFNEHGVIRLEKNSEPHGIFYDKRRNFLFIGAPGRDSILVVDCKSQSMSDEIFISNKWKRNKKDNHHINDLLVVNDSLYVSMFSFSGNWLHEIYDGGIMEINLLDYNDRKIMVDQLWMPHSISRINSKYTYLNSMLGELYYGNYGKVFTSNGFLRGLDFDGNFFYIGQTEHRYPEKLANHKQSISMDVGVIVFDPKSKMSKFYPIPNVDSIHSVIVN